MKKILITISLLITTVYLSSAVDIVLNSWQKLDNNNWTDLSSVLNKVDINSGDLNISWKLVVNWKICDLDWNCLWECPVWQVCDMETDGWDWKLVMNLDTNDGNVQWYDSSYWTDLTTWVWS